MNLGQMKALVRRRIGNPSTTDVTDTTIIDEINGALEEIRDKYKFLRARGRARFMTEAGVDKYTISALTDVVLKVWDRTNKNELTKVGPRFVAENEFDGTVPEQSKPKFYARFEDYIQILGDQGQPPDGAYSIELLFKSKFAPLAADAEVPDLPTTWHRGACILAAFNYYDADGKDAAKAQYQLAAWQRWVSDKPVEAHEEAEAIDSGVEIPTLGRGEGGTNNNIPWDMQP